MSPNIDVPAENRRLVNSLLSVINKAEEARYLLGWYKKDKDHMYDKIADIRRTAMEIVTEVSENL